MPKKASEILAEVTELKRMWQVRNTRMEASYKVLMLEDELKTPNMESFVSNDPRTFFNLSRHLLTPEVIPHQVVEEVAGRAQAGQYSGINTFLEKQWARLDRISRRRGLQSWLRNLVSYILAVGWYSVFAIATPDECVAEVWSPAEVYPDFGDDELVRCAHAYTLQPTAAKRKIALKGWSYKGNITIPVELTDYWYVDGTNVMNSIMVGTQLVKPDQATPFKTIPILVSPVGGLPDRGVIIKDETWKEHIGESLLATNEGVYRQFNKQMSFLQQLLRDTAQARWFERSASGTQILTPETVYKRGAIFRGGPNDSIEVLPVPPIPVDIRISLMDIQNMIQRGALPWALYGNIQQEMAAYLMSQIAASAHQVLKDYKFAAKAVLEDVDKLWLTHIQEQNLHPYAFQLSPDLPPEFDVEVGLDITIAGDLIQRVSVARMMNPEFRISGRKTMQLMFPEIKDPLLEQAAANAERALEHPVAQTVSMIQAWRDEAARLREAKLFEQAELFEKAAGQLEQQIGAAGTQQPTPRAPRPEGVTPPAGEVIPREFVEGVGP